MMRCGMPILLPIEVAARASVVATTAPSRNPDFQSNFENTCSPTIDAPQTVNATSPNASMEIEGRFL